MRLYQADTDNTTGPRDGGYLVEACDLHKSYGTAKAVRGISFGVKRGEVVGFLGPNGAGKSTTMKMLTGFLKPTAGMAKVGGVSVADDPLAVRRSLGYLPENAPLYDEMMVCDFLTFIAELRGVPAVQRRSRLQHACERCGLQDVLGKDIGQLSKGFRQRVGLAQAMVHDPDLLILDEPTSGLDPNQIIEIRALIRDLGRDKTIILSTHILPEVQATCDRIIIINDGRLVADDRPDALTADAAARAQAVTVQVTFKPRDAVHGDADAVGSLLGGLPGVRKVQPRPAAPGTLSFALQTAAQPDVREAIFDVAVAHQLVILDLHRQEGSLEDAFRALTRGAQSDDTSGLDGSGSGVPPFGHGNKSEAHVQAGGPHA